MSCEEFKVERGENLTNRGVGEHHHLIQKVSNFVKKIALHGNEATVTTIDHQNIWIFL